MLQVMPHEEKRKYYCRPLTYDMSFVTKVKFDLNNRYVVGYGLKKIFLLNIEQNKSK